MMKLKMDALHEHIESKFEGKYRRFAKEIGMSQVQMWRIINSKHGIGMQFYSRMMAYCEKNGLEQSLFFETTDAPKKC